MSALAPIRPLAFAGFGTLAGCSGYLAPPLETFHATTQAAHPIGSPLQDLRADLTAKGFAEGRPFGPPSARSLSFVRTLRFGIWAGGTRHVCVDANTSGRLTALDVDEFVMSP